MTPKTLSRKDWLLLFVVCAVSGILGIWGFRMAGQPVGHLASIGLSLLFALLISTICGYLWRIKSHWHASKAMRMTMVVVPLVVAAIAFLFGAEFNGQALLYVAGHGMPDWSGFGLQTPWAWVLIPALGVAYIQAWTLLRTLLILLGDHKRPT